MPDKPLTVFTYAASASLAAVALVYFFHPSYLFDGDASATSANARKKGIVGLQNPANDCFINCVLQSLAGLGDLRVFLIREIHRRDLVSSEIYDTVPGEHHNGKVINAEKVRSLQNGDVTKGLKSMIDRLNEKPIHQKTISAGRFIQVLELAFGSTISKTQQDAQEFLQLVAERLNEEYHAGAKARERYTSMAEKEETVQPDGAEDDNTLFQEGGFSLEGQTQTRVECGHCHFVPKAKPTSFVMLNLMVPQKASSTLNDCFDAHFKREYIDDYKCDRCRLTHALEVYKSQMARKKSDEERSYLQLQMEKIEESLANDPESPPEDLVLPDIKHAPKRRISRNVEITSFPRVLVIHLSRSIYDRNSYSMKNSARVTFPEYFPTGGLLKRRNYKLLGVITHKGTHNSGHYETFRRQHVYAPYSNPHTDRESGPYSARSSLALAPSMSPVIQPLTTSSGTNDNTMLSTEKCRDSTDLSSSRTSGTNFPPSTRPSTASEDLPKHRETSQTTSARIDLLAPPAPEPEARHFQATSVKNPTQAATSPKASSRLRRKRKASAHRWWRISDDKIKECKTAEVLSMAREVYILFYEIE